MRYALILHSIEPAEGEIPEEARQQMQAAFDAYAKSLDAAGVLKGADIMASSQVTTQVTTRDGALHVQDGPFAEAKEMLAGVFVIDVPDLDAALAWAEQNPGATYGVVEVRPVAISFFDGEWHTKD